MNEMNERTSFGLQQMPWGNGWPVHKTDNLTTIYEITA
jgi:hypothetical protein